MKYQQLLSRIGIFVDHLINMGFTEIKSIDKPFQVKYKDQIIIQFHEHITIVYPKHIHSIEYKGRWERKIFSMLKGKIIQPENKKIKLLDELHRELNDNPEAVNLLDDLRSMLD